MTGRKAVLPLQKRCDAVIQPHATTHDELPVTMPHTMEDSKMPRSKLQGGLRVREEHGFA